jgi:hypothetical protein
MLRFNRFFTPLLNFNNYKVNQPKLRGDEKAFKCECQQSTVFRDVTVKERHFYAESANII